MSKHRFSVRYVHKISPRETDAGPNVELSGADLLTKGKLGAALRKQGVDESISEFRVEKDGRVVAFPTRHSIWHSIIMTPEGSPGYRRADLGKPIKKYKPPPKLSEAEGGDFIVRYSNGSRSRHWDMPRAVKAAETQLKDEPRGSRAEFFRAPIGDPSKLKGAPWTEPYFVLEKDEYGHVRMGKLKA